VNGVDENMTVTVPLTENPPTIDGELSEGEWDGAATLGGFRCLTPDHGQPAALDTTVQLIGVEGRLYVVFECQIEDPTKLRISETREDARLQGQDRVSILLDTLHDHRRQIELSVTARGTKYDARWGNNEWDAIWDVAAAVYDQSYIVEIGIDLASLTHERGGEQTIGANFVRYVQAPDEDTAWAVDERTTAWN
jgi:hypothetical protein